MYLVRKENLRTLLFCFSAIRIFVDMLKLGLPDFLRQRQGNAGESVNCLKNSDSEPESDGSSDCGQQLAE